MLCQHGLIGHIVGHFAQAIHIVGKGKQLSRNVGQRFKSAADHGCPQHFIEGATSSGVKG